MSKGARLRGAPWLRPLALLGALLGVGGQAAAGDIYRYQDAYGNWHFTDEPPPGVEADVIPDIKTGSTRSKTSAPAADDLGARLEAAFDSISPIARAALAVVSIRGPGGSGSGFFCNVAGELLTEQRLVGGGGGAPAEALTAPNEGAAALEEELAAGRARLERMEKDLEGYARVIKNAQDASARAWAEATEAELRARYQAEAEALAALELALGARSGPAGGGPTADTAGAPGSGRVDLYLKDGTALHARVLEEAPDLGLVVLKLDGFRTPALPLDPEVELAEGVRVFAIGRAVGLQDAVSSGALTQVGAHELLTDAAPLPGQGGGPLIDDSGRLLGVFAGAQGDPPQGRAIPVLRIRRALPSACR